MRVFAANFKIACVMAGLALPVNSACAAEQAENAIYVLHGDDTERLTEGISLFRQICIANPDAPDRQLEVMENLGVRYHSDVASPGYWHGLIQFYPLGYADRCGVGIYEPPGWQLAKNELQKALGLEVHPQRNPLNDEYFWEMPFGEKILRISFSNRAGTQGIGALVISSSIEDQPMAEVINSLGSRE